MRLPNKDTPYADSVIALFPQILERLEAGEKSIQDMYDFSRKQEWDSANFFSALDCLFAMGRIELDEKRSVLHYVEENPV